jgi:hypothetical protein
MRNGVLRALEMGHAGRVLLGRRRKHPLHRTLTIWLMAALLLGAHAAHAGARAPRTCKRTGVRDVAADARGRLYVDRRNNWYACLRARNRPVLIAQETVDVDAPVVSSPFAALVTESISSFGATFDLNIADMRHGDVESQQVDAAIAELALTRHGVAAFILGPPVDSHNNPIGPPRVQTMDRNGTITNRDEGDIDIRSLALSRDGRHLYWIKDGSARTAVL